MIDADGAHPSRETPCFIFIPHPPRLIVFNKNQPTPTASL